MVEESALLKNKMRSQSRGSASFWLQATTENLPSAKGAG